MFSILTALSMTVSTIVLVITGIFGQGGEGAGGSPPRDGGGRGAGGCYFKFPWKGGWTVGFVAEHTWALIVFVAGLVVWWLMQEVKKG